MITVLRYDDSDMKIVGSAERKKEDINTADFLAALAQQHFNGNYAKAKALGSNIVSAFSYRAAPEELKELVREAGVAPDDDVMLQVKILSVFSAEYCLNTYMPSALLSGVALGGLYEILEDVSPDFYAALSHSTAFSFYYLAMKGNGDVPALIGRQFAALCGKPDDEAYCALGEKLHRMNVDVYKKAIRGFAFV